MIRQITKSQSQKIVHRVLLSRLMENVVCGPMIQTPLMYGHYRGKGGSGSPKESWMSRFNSTSKRTPAASLSSKIIENRVKMGCWPRKAVSGGIQQAQSRHEVLTCDCLRKRISMTRERFKANIAINPFLQIFAPKCSYNNLKVLRNGYPCRIVSWLVVETLRDRCDEFVDKEQASSAF